MSGLAYLTADRIGGWGGGPTVTSQELLALREFSEEQTLSRRDPLLSSIAVFSRDNLGNNLSEPWRWDDFLVSRQDFPYLKPKLCHIYSGTFSKTAAILKERGCKIVWTIAAHDRVVSRSEHEKLGIDFAKTYPHLCEEKLWKRYIEGYRLAEVIVCPSTVAEKTVRAYGPDFVGKDIKVISHGCDLPRQEDIKPLPTNFVVGYMGAISADKGVKYLLEAWKSLNYSDGSLLILAGKDSTSPVARWMVEKFGGGNIHLMGWLNNVADFYNSISLYVQPSATEGFGLEVLEAASYKRSIICSEGAGAIDLLKNNSHGMKVVPCDSGAIAQVISLAKELHLQPVYKDTLTSWGEAAYKEVEKYTWDKIRKQYREVWAEVLQ